MGAILRRYGAAFLRQFPHTPPGVMVRLRQYGLLAHRDLGRRLAHCRQVLAASSAVAPAVLPQAPADANPVRAAAATADPRIDSVALVLLWPLLLYAPLPAATATLEPPPLAAMAPGPRCRTCWLGRLQTVWQAPRPTGRNLPELTAWTAGPFQEKPAPRDTS